LTDCQNEFGIFFVKLLANMNCRSVVMMMSLQKSVVNAMNCRAC